MKRIPRLHPYNPHARLLRPFTKLLIRLSLLPEIRHDQRFRAKRCRPVDHPVEKLDNSADMIKIRMRHKDVIEFPDPLIFEEGQDPVPADVRHCRRSPVHENVLSAGHFHNDRIPLPDIQHVDLEIVPSPHEEHHKKDREHPGQKESFSVRPPSDGKEKEHCEQRPVDQDPDRLRTSADKRGTGQSPCKLQNTVKKLRKPHRRHGKNTAEGTAADDPQDPRPQHERDQGYDQQIQKYTIKRNLVPAAEDERNRSEIQDHSPHERTPVRTQSQNDDRKKRQLKSAVREVFRIHGQDDSRRKAHPCERIVRPAGEPGSHSQAVHEDGPHSRDRKPGHDRTADQQEHRHDVGSLFVHVQDPNVGRKPVPPVMFFPIRASFPARTQVLFRHVLFTGVFSLCPLPFRPHILLSPVFPVLSYGDSDRHMTKNPVKSLRHHRYMKSRNHKNVRHPGHPEPVRILRLHKAPVPDEHRAHDARCPGRKDLLNSSPQQKTDLPQCFSQWIRPAVEDLYIRISHRIIDPKHPIIRLPVELSLVRRRLRLAQDPFCTQKRTHSKMLWIF